MKFLQKRWVAVTLCILMIVSALTIGQLKEQRRVTSVPESVVVDENVQDYASYLRFIQDDAGLLSDETVQGISRMNATFDSSCRSVCGIGIMEQIESVFLEDAAFQMKDTLGLGERDFFLLLDVGSEAWYFVYGDEAAFYVDDQLERLVTDAMELVFQEPEQAISALYSELAVWYSGHMAEHSEAVQEYQGGYVAGGRALFVFLIVALIMVAVISSLLRAGRRFVGSSGGWIPWVFFGGNRRRTYFRSDPGYGPRPNPGARPGGTQFRGSGIGRNAGSGNRSNVPRSGGLGGSKNRGSSGRGGGFGGNSRGGSSRGGGFGGHR